MGLPRWVGRAIGLDVHREFCEVAICEDGEVRSAGRVPATPEGVSSLADSLLPSDRVALEVTGSCWEVARILEPRVNRVVVVSPDDTGIVSARAKTDRLDARALASLLWKGELEAVWMPDERCRTSFVSYNPATDTTHTLATPPFSFTDWGGLAPYKGKIYGQDGNGNQPAEFAVYDVATNKWKQLPNGPNGMVLGAAIDPVTGIFYAYGSYREYEWYGYDIATGKWLRSLLFPHRSLDDGGMAYVSTPKLQGIYAILRAGQPRVHPLRDAPPPPPLSMY